MKEFLYALLIEPFQDGFWGGFLAILMWIVTLGIAGLILWGTFYFIDSSFLEEKRGQGIVVNKYIVPAHSETTYTHINGVMIPNTTYYSTTWNIEIQIGELTDNFGLGQDEYDSIDIGQKMNCIYSNGRMFTTLYIKSIKYLPNE